VHRRPRSIALVALGGASGTAARYQLSQVVPPVQDVPVGILVVNVVGAFVLGLLLERLLRGPDTGARLDLRLLLGTGFLGGLTTYSALATDTVALLVAGGTGRALAYALGTLVLGLLASLVGIWCGGRTSPPGAAS
jgi:CrcB protein